MSTDKILQRIQLQIDELTPTLELFVDDTIQPSVADCERFQKILSGLQENVAIFKYNKQNKEISPSFNIHAKLSAATVEKEEVTEKKTEAPITAEIKDIKETVKVELEEKKEIKHLNQELPKTEIPKTEGPKVDPEPVKVGLPKSEPVHTESLKPKPALAIGLNDKFRFMNELFGQNSSEYNIALEQINNVSSWHDAEIYLNSLKNVYEWDPKEEVVKYFFSVIKKRFD